VEGPEPEERPRDVDPDRELGPAAIHRAEDLRPCVLQDGGIPLELALEVVLQSVWVGRVDLEGPAVELAHLRLVDPLPRPGERGYGVHVLVPGVRREL
jgi:hypothetical protein